MNYTSLKNKDYKDIFKLLKEKKLELFTLKVKHKTMQLKNTAELKAIKKDIAKIKTYITAHKIDKIMKKNNDSKEKNTINSNNKE